MFTSLYKSIQILQNNKSTFPFLPQQRHNNNNSMASNGYSRKLLLNLANEAYYESDPDDRYHAGGYGSDSEAGTAVARSLAGSQSGYGSNSEAGTAVARSLAGSQSGYGSDSEAGTVVGRRSVAGSQIWNGSQGTRYSQDPDSEERCDQLDIVHLRECRATEKAKKDTIVARQQEVETRGRIRLALWWAQDDSQAQGHKEQMAYETFCRRETEKADLRRFLMFVGAFVMFCSAVFAAYMLKTAP